MSDMQIFRSAGLYERDFVSGAEGFNLAAVLLFGRDETIRSCVPAYKTDAIYRVENTDRYDDREDVRTNLIDSFDKLVSFICRHTDDRFFLEGTQRISVQNMIAREIVSNLLMHREYASPFPAKLIIEKDRILTENANKTYHYGRIQADNFTPYPKNPIIANFFNQIGRADELGSGVRNLYKYTKLYANSEPVLFEDDIFRTEVPLSTADKPTLTADKLPINQQEQQILEYIKENMSITNAQACELLTLKASRVKELFRDMTSKGLIVPTGEKKSRKYLLPASDI